MTASYVRQPNFPWDPVLAKIPLGSKSKEIILKTLTTEGTQMLTGCLIVDCSLLYFPWKCRCFFVVLIGYFMPSKAKAKSVDRVAPAVEMQFKLNDLIETMLSPGSAEETYPEVL